MSRETSDNVDHDEQYAMYYRDRSENTMGLERSRSPPNRDIEITDVQTTVVGGNYEWIFVRIYTDTGITGTGEAYWGHVSNPRSARWNRSYSARTHSISTDSTRT